MDERRAGLDRFDRIEHGGQVLVLDLDERQRLFRDVRIERGHHGDLLADEAHAIAREQRHVEHAAPDEEVRHVRGREDREHAGQRASLHGVDADDARVRERAAQGFAPDHPGQRHVRGIPRRARDLVGAVEPPDPLSDDPHAQIGQPCSVMSTRLPSGSWIQLSATAPNVFDSAGVSAAATIASTSSTWKPK